MTPQTANEMNHITINHSMFQSTMFFPVCLSHCLCFLFHLCPSLPNPPTSRLCSPICLFRQVPVRVCEHVSVCVWWEGLLQEEVASHESQLMSITLIRSSIHPHAQGPIHPPLFTPVNPESPQARSHRTLTHDYRGELSLTHS